ncbi:hypothetical protein KUCAC02_004839, partial [Chaenocephalus aceratus]
GGLRNSRHESTLSSQEYVHELRSGITEEKLLNCLESLRVSLTSNPVRAVKPVASELWEVKSASALRKANWCRGD